MCGVEVRRGGLGGTYLLPTLSVAGASLFPPCFRFHTPLIEPDVQICGIRLSETTHAIAKAIACDAVCIADPSCKFGELGRSARETQFALSQESAEKHVGEPLCQTNRGKMVHHRAIC